MKTTQELQQEFNEGVSKALSEIVGLGEESLRSRNLLFDLIELNTKQIKAMQVELNILMASGVSKFKKK